MVSNKLWVLTTAALLSISLVSNANQAVEDEVVVEPVTPARSVNRFNPSYGIASLRRLEMRLLRRLLHWLLRRPFQQRHP